MGARLPCKASFPRRAFRRPLTASEAERVAAVFDAGAAAGGLALGVQTAVEALLQSPQFLYREELGLPGVVTDAGRVPLTPFELASQLSFMVTGSMPDAELFAAAEQGRLGSAEDVTREATRLLGQPRARESLRELFHQWLTIDHLDGLTKDAKVYPWFTPELAGAMKRDFDLLLDEELWGSDGSLRALLLSDRALVDAGLAQVYGVPPPDGAAAQPTLLDAAVRPGFLTRPAFLSVHGAADGGGPVARGVFVLQSLFCRDIPPPPPDVIPPPSGATEGQIDLRSRPGVAQHSSDARCAPCHVLIDGVGFGFERFDGIGAYRTHYADGTAVDSRGQLLGTDIDGPFDGVAQLAERMAGSKQVLDCFATQLYRFAMGDVEPRGSVSARRFGLAIGSRVTDALLRLVASPTFLERVPE
jgi:Protein of unknown function (DUF1592)/Protein of unknown function (DUF1588)/Protein of unknown function (DUF1595)